MAPVPLILYCYNMGGGWGDCPMKGVGDYMKNDVCFKAFFEKLVPLK